MFGDLVKPYKSSMAMYESAGSSTNRQLTVPRLKAATRIGRKLPQLAITLVTAEPSTACFRIPQTPSLCSKGII